MTVTLSTARFYDQAASAFGRLSARAARLNTEVATGHRLQAAADDPLAWTRLAGLRREGADDAAFKGNLDVAAGVLSGADTALSSASDQLAHAAELATQAANGTLSAEDRRVIGDALAGVVETLAGLANATDLRGAPLFGGADGGAGAVLQPDGGWRLAATAPSAIPVGADQGVQANEAAARVFGFRTKDGRDTDALAAVQAVAAALRAGDPVPAGALDDLRGAVAQVADAQGSLGARAARVEMLQGQLADVAVDRDAATATLEGSTTDDMAAAITELQKTMTVLQATQASFSKLSQLSLFDYLR